MSSIQEMLVELGLAADAPPQEVERVAESRVQRLRERIAAAADDGERKSLELELTRLSQWLDGWIRAPGPSPTLLHAASQSGAPRGPMQLAAGIELAQGRYRLTGLLGRGGMGEVHSAWDSLLEREVALKVVLPGMLGERTGDTGQQLADAMRQRFLAEASATTTLSHAHVIRVFDVHADGELLFITMEKLEGQTLRQQLARRVEQRQPFTVEEVLQIAGTVCEALEYAHRFLVHRDIKPENVFLCSDGTLKLMDFGIARIGWRDLGLTEPGMAIGTRGYMAPEQLRGQQVDHRADQYALGVMLYELLAGRMPSARAKSVRELRPDVPEAMSRAIDQALEESPAARHADMRAFATALRGAPMAHSAQPKKPTTAVPWLLIVPLVLVGCVAVLGLALWLTRDQWRPLFADEEHQGEPSAASSSGTPRDPPSPSDDPRTPAKTAEVPAHTTPTAPPAPAGPNDVVDGKTALIRATERGDLAEVRDLLDGGALPDVTSTSNAVQALHVAAERDFAPIARLLIERRARIDSVREERWTPLHVCARYDSAEVAAVLIAAAREQRLEGYLDAGESNARTPLHIAASNASQRVWRALIEAGAQLAPADNRGFTPLHALAQSTDAALWPAQLAMAELLVAKLTPEQLKKRASDLNSPLDLARQDGRNVRLAELLKQHAGRR